MAMLFGSASVWMWGMMLSLSDVRESDEVSAVPQCYRAGERRRSPRATSLASHRLGRLDCADHMERGGEHQHAEESQ
jgi:hypothetical protein